MKLSIRRIADRMDAGPDPVRIWGRRRSIPTMARRDPESAPPSLAELHRTADRGRTETSLRSLLERHGDRADRRSPIRLAAWNTALTPDAAVRIDGPLGLGTTLTYGTAKPGLAERATRMGTRFSEHGVDVVALSEVFDDAELERILESWRRAGARRLTVGDGPGPSRRSLARALLQVASAGTSITTYGLDRLLRSAAASVGSALRASIQALGSGLRTVTDDLPVASRTHHVFESRGWPTRDADFWSNKGALLTRLSTNPGAIDLYSTHLIAGGGLEGRNELPDALVRFIEFVAGGARPLEVEGYRERQLEELAHFIRATHEPTNPLLLVGDLNVDASTDEYRRLLRILGSIDIPVTDRGGSPRNFVRVALEQADRVRDAIERWLHSDSIASETRATTGLRRTLWHWLSSDEREDPEFLCRLATRHTRALADILGWSVQERTTTTYDLWRATRTSSGPTFFFGESAARPSTVCEMVEGENGCVCDESVPVSVSGPRGAGRIDYVFASHPDRLQTTRMELSRPRRRPYPNTPDSDGAGRTAHLDRDDSDFLSDHLGLEISIVPWSPPDSTNSSAP